MILRNDDINPNTDFESTRKMYELFLAKNPDAEIVSAVTILAEETENGSCYKNLKPKDIKFPLVDKVIDLDKLAGLGTIVSHGLWHLDHKHASYELQEYSIVSSCRILKTKIFVPPFMRWNKDTAAICRKHGIELWGEEKGWFSLDRNKFEPGHKRYVLHSWLFTPEEFAQKL
jgi:hypothetical protein